MENEEELRRLAEFIEKSGVLLAEADSSILSQYLSSKSAQAILSTFAKEPVPLLVLTPKNESKGETKEDGVEVGNQEKSFELSLDGPKDSVNSGVAFIKRNSNFELDKPIASQLYVLVINESNPSDLFASYIHNAFTPFFNSYAAKFPSESSDKLSIIFFFLSFFLPFNFLLIFF